jgi:hypothetical protein
MNMKIPVFRDVTPCSLTEGNDVSEEPTPSIPATETADFSKTLVSATRLHGATAQRSTQPARHRKNSRA